MVFQRYLRTLLLSVLVLGATFGAATAQRPQPDRGPLFRDAPQAPQSLLDPRGEMGVARRRIVQVDLEKLNNIAPGTKLDFNLFDDVNLTATVTSAESRGSGPDQSLSYVGEIDEAPLGEAFIVSSAGQIAADISTPQGMYQVRPAGDDLYAVEQIDQSQFPEELPPVEIGAAELQSQPGQAAGEYPAPLAAEDNGSIIDVLVLWTPAARQTEGGVTAIRNRIALAVSEANQSYANSGITQRLNLVYAGETSTAESNSMNTDLSRLQSATDAYFAEAHNLRNQYQADLVSLIVNSGEYCGIAFHMSVVSAAFRDYAFSVVARSCATGYYSFAHELGHNMGARHDWFVDTDITPSSYSHGYVNPAARWRTIMAYDNDCQRRGFTCTRLPLWSNPAVAYWGLPTGIRGGTNTSCRPGDLSHPACDADDHRTLNETAYTVANFRVRTPSGPTPTPKPFWQYPFRSFLPTVRK